MDGTCMNCGQVGNWCTCGDPPDTAPAPVTPVFALPQPPRSKSIEPVLFRAVVDHADGTGQHPFAGPYKHKEVAEDMATLLSNDGRVSRDATLTVQSSHTAADGTVTWHDQTVVQRPRGERWKAYCESHTFCDACGQIIPKVEGQHVDRV